MSSDPNDVVKVYRGTMIEVEMFQQVLQEAGIESKVLGDDLSAGLGSAIPGSVELWIHQRDMEKAIAAIKRDEEQKGRREAHERFPHPTDE